MRDLREIPGRWREDSQSVCSIAAAVAAAATVGGALISSNGAKDAAKTQANAANQAAATQLQMYQQTRQDLLPFASTGASAMSQLANIFGFGPGGGGPNAAAATSALTQFPGYQFGLTQGVSALDRSAASRGMAVSGAQQKAITRYGQDYGAQQAWQPYISGLQYASTLGENAAAMTGSAGTSAASGAASSQLAAGQAGASGQVATSNILAQSFNELGSQLGNFVGGPGPSQSQLVNSGFVNTGPQPGDPPY